MQPKGKAIRKRTQIATANRIMFLWVAGVSVVFGLLLSVYYDWPTGPSIVVVAAAIFAMSLGKKLV